MDARKNKESGGDGLRVRRRINISGREVFFFRRLSELGPIFSTPLFLWKRERESETPAPLFASLVFLSS